MKIIDCPWELANLDCRVAEISVKAEETIDRALIQALETEYDYLVLKIQAGQMLNNVIASEMGFVLAETQMALIKAKRDWNFESDVLTKKTDGTTFR